MQKSASLYIRILFRHSNTRLTERIPELFEYLHICVMIVISVIAMACAVEFCPNHYYNKLLSFKCNIKPKRFINCLTICLCHCNFFIYFNSMCVVIIMLGFSFSIAPCSYMIMFSSELRSLAFGFNNAL